jgi:predicted MFS family arabinose efflux permease
MLTFTGAASAMTYGLIYANEHGWASGTSLVMFVAAALLLVVFVGVERRVRDAMLDLSLLGNKTFLGVVLAAGLLTFAAFASFTYTSIWLQSVLGLSPIRAGLVGLPLSIAAFTVSAAIGRFITAMRPGPIIGTGLLLVSAGDLIGVLLVHGSARWAALVPGLFIAGLGVGLVNPSLNSTGMAAVAPQRGGMAAGAVNTSRQLGFAFGIALLGSVFSARVESVLRDHHVPNAASLAHLVSGGQAGRVLGQTPASGRAELSDTLHAAAVSGVQGALLVAGIVGVVAGLLTLWLVRAPAAPHGGPQQPAEPTRPPDDAEGTVTLPLR